MRRVTSALGRLVGTVSLLTAVPAVLIRLVGWPWPHHLPTAGQWQAWARQPRPPLTRAVIIDAAVILGWLLWATLLAAVLAGVYTHLARLYQRLPHLRLPGPLQSLCAAMLGTIAVSSSVNLLTAPPAHAAAVDTAPHQPDASHPTRAHPTDQAQPRDQARTPTSSPTRGPAHGSTTAPATAYRVVAGDTLWDIATTKLADPNRWRDIYHLNQGRRQANGYALTNPDEIDIGWVLVLPPTAPTTPGHHHRPRPDGDPPTATGAGGPAAAGHSPTTPAPTSRPPGPATPAPVAGTGTARSPAPHTTPTTAGNIRHDQRGIALPSQGWVSLGLAATIAAASILLRLHQRRRARLHFPIPVRTGRQPAPLPRSLAPLDAAGSRLLNLDQDSALPGLLPAPPPIPAPVGVDAHGDQVSLFDLPGPGLALHGPGSEPVARAVLAAALSTGVVSYLATRPVVVTTVHTLTRLLPPGTPPVGLDPNGTSFDGERLLVLPDPDAAISHAEQEMIHRRRLLQDMDTDSVTTLNARDDHAEHQPPYLLLIESDPRHAARVHAVAAHRHRLHLHPVLLGAAEGMPTYQVAADGTLTAAPGHPTPAGGARMSPLAASDLADVLAMLTQAAPRPETGDEPTDTQAEPADLDLAVEVGDIPAVGSDQATPAPVRLCVLGPVTLATTDGPITTGVRSGSRAVLAVLAAHPHGRSFEQTADVLHPDTDPDTGINRVRTDLNAIRSLLREATGITGKGKFIVYDPATGRYRIDPNMIEVDLWRMLAAIDRANNTGDDEAACLAALRQAVDCYRGDFAEGQDRAWILDYATTYRHQLLSAYARIAEILEPDQPEQAIAALQTAIEYDPVNEQLYQRLMRIQGRLARPDAVRRTLRLLENRLAELGEAEPCEATRRIAARQLNPTPTSHR